MTDEHKAALERGRAEGRIVRDYLETLDWDKTAPGPRLPAEIIEKTAAKYAEACAKLTA